MSDNQIKYIIAGILIIAIANGLAAIAYMLINA